VSDDGLRRRGAPVRATVTRKIEAVGSVVTGAAVAAVEATARLERAARAAHHLRALLGRSARVADATASPGPRRAERPARSASARRTASTGTRCAGRRCGATDVGGLATIRGRRARRTAI